MNLSLIIIVPTVNVLDMLAPQMPQINTETMVTYINSISMSCLCKLFSKTQINHIPDNMEHYDSD